MKVYIASFFADKDRVALRSKELQEMGIEITNRWHSEKAPHNASMKDFSDDYFRETAVFDIDDIIAADVLVLTVPTDTQMADCTFRSMARGGRHFESGFMYGLIMAAHLNKTETQIRRELILLGARENVFHFLDGEGVTKHYPVIRQFETWDEVKSYLGGK